MIYEEIFREFEQRDIRYLVVGGMAVNLYGYVRLTMDLDIMVGLSDDNFSKIANVMEKFNYTPRGTQWLKRKSVNYFLVSMKDKNWNLWLDIVILFKTVKVVLKSEGAR